MTTITTTRYALSDLAAAQAPAPPEAGPLIPALWTAASDPVLWRDRLALCVYLRLLPRLDLHLAKRLPIHETARALDLQPATLARALEVLCERGYLERRTIQDQADSYRLFFNRRYEDPRLPPTR